MTSIEKLIHLVSRDKSNPTTRLHMAQSMGLSDRECRKLKRKAFLEGIPIITSSDRNGMYISHDRSDILKVRSQAVSRIRKDAETVKACDRILETINQVKL